MKKVCVIPLLCLGLWFGNPMVTLAEQGDSEFDASITSPANNAVATDVWDRIRQGYKMPTYESPLVDKWVKYYAEDHADYLNRMFNRSGRYLYQVIEDVEARGLPTELALLPFVESAFQPEVLSKAKASGLWQFMPATGKTYDLAQNRWRDERQDVLESTRAALDYFQYLYGLFGDWHLSLAAYNWGEGSVQRAIKRASAKGQATDYGHLKMPNETANYVPKLQAIKHIVSNPEKYGVTLPDVGNEPYFVTITKPRDIDTNTAAELARMNVEEFRMLNPSFKLPVIVAAHDNLMHLPADKIDGFVDNLASWMDSGQRLSRWTTYVTQPNDTLASVAQQFGMTEAELRSVNAIPSGRKVLANSTLFVKAIGEEQQDITIAASEASLQLSPETTWRRVTYRVRRGDTLNSIAARWKISQKSIIRTNRLRNGNLKVGQRLVLTVPNVERAPIQVASSTPSKTSSSSSTSKPRLHSVRSGESLSVIAKKYDISLQDLREANPKVSNRLQAGQRLRIPEAGEKIEVPKFYIVKKGDTLMEVSRQTGASVSQLQRANRLTNANLQIGQRLEIPNVQEAREIVPPKATATKQASSSGTYTVRRGDTLHSIAVKNKISVNELKKANNLRSNSIKVGQRLTLP